MAATRSMGKMFRPVVVILGATATGKSRLALEMALRFNGEIISADSMQVYKGLDIVTNKVPMSDRVACTHHLLDYVSPLKADFTVTEFRDASLPIIDDILNRNKLPIIVGGTNYYIESLLWNFLLDASPESVSPISIPPPNTVSPKTCSPSLPVDPISRSPPKPVRIAGCLQTELKSDGLKDQLSDTDSEKGDSPNTKRSRSQSERRTVVHVEAAYSDRTTDDIVSELKSVDPESARRIHPKDRRKIIRALDVYRQTGVTKTDHLAAQHAETGTNALSGSLRYPNTCMIWVQCDQNTLDARIDGRVDEMITAGLLGELSQFHKEYNLERLANKEIADYTLGIFQSIGFKEFHAYLTMNEDDQRLDTGRELLKLAVDEVKRNTRQYARKQIKWINNRFLKRRDSTALPPMYGVDSTDPDLWKTGVHDRASHIISSFIQRVVCEIEPLPRLVNNNERVYNHCSYCDLVFVTKTDWEAHVHGRRHRKTVQGRRKLERYLAEAAVKTPSLDVSVGSVASEKIVVS